MIINKKLALVKDSDMKKLVTDSDMKIIKAHSSQFFKPVLTVMELSKLHLTEQELLKNEDFKRVISEMREIGKQGYKSQFLLFCNMIMEDLIDSNYRSY